MAFLPYVRVVARGTIDTAQTWSVGFSVTNDGTATAAELVTYLTSVDGLLKTYFAAVGNTSLLWSNGTTYSVLNAYAYPALGHAAVQAGLASSGVVGTVANHCPQQLSLVVSNRSGFGGRANRGRFYLPVTASGAWGNNGQIANATCTAIAAATKTLYDAMNALTIGTAGAIVSIAGRDSGAHAPVQAIWVNGKVDTQRRRTDKIAPAFTAIAVV